MKNQTNIMNIRINVTHIKISEVRHMDFRVESILSPEVVCGILKTHSKYKRVEVLSKRSKYSRRSGQKVYSLEELIVHLNNHKCTTTILKEDYEFLRTREYLGKLRLNGLRMLGVCQKYGYTYIHMVSTTDGVVPCESDVLKLFRSRFIPEGNASLPGMIKCGPNAPYPDSYGFDALLEVEERYVRSGVYEYIIHKYKTTIRKVIKEVEIELL